ncbi:hypothetical protein ACFLTA_06095 [Bacteroidota bacterium]
MTEVSFRIKMEGFTLKDGPHFPEPDSIEFSYRHSGGQITFTFGGQRHYYVFKDNQIEDNLITIPAGEYLMELHVPEASLYGQSSGSFMASPQTVNITEHTDTLTISVEVNCSMIIVSDEEDHLDEGSYIIERHTDSYFAAYPMARDATTGLYYTYFTPDPESDDPSAFIWFYSYSPGEERGGMSTTGFEPGYRYFISVLE